MFNLKRAVTVSRCAVFYSFKVWFKSSCKCSSQGHPPHQWFNSILADNRNSDDGQAAGPECMHAEPRNKLRAECLLHECYYWRGFLLSTTTTVSRAGQCRTFPAVWILSAVSVSVLIRLFLTDWRQMLQKSMLLLFLGRSSGESLKLLIS